MAEKLGVEEELWPMLPPPATGVSTCISVVLGLPALRLSDPPGVTPGEEGGLSLSDLAPLASWQPGPSACLNPHTGLLSGCFLSLLHASYSSLHPTPFSFHACWLRAPLLVSICCESVLPGVCSIPTASATCQVPSALQTPLKRAKSPRRGDTPSHLWSYPSIFPCTLPI